jgi:hypothetical protein
MSRRSSMTFKVKGFRLSQAVKRDVQASGAKELGSSRPFELRKFTGPFYFGRAGRYRCNEEMRT